MSISLSCECGRALRVKDEAAGRKVRCPGCGNVLPVPRPATDTDAEDEALDILLTESAGNESPSPPPKAAAEHVQEPPRRPAPPPESSRPSWARQAASERPKAAAKIRKKRREESGGGIAIHPSIIAGVGMMVGAAVWFFVGLSFNYIYFYPPILFVLGIGAVIRGFTGQE